ncbi:MAG: hypothetical protein O3B41_10665 [Bacteroidetes bacterium]|nr:hypothetical protein [Bacteroidota bacterium]
MDIDIKFWLAILAIYLVQLFLGKKKKPVQTDGPVLQPKREHYEVDRGGSNEFHDALAEISTMLTGRPPESKKPSPRFETVPAETVTPRLPQKSELPKKTPSINVRQSFFDDVLEKKEYVAFHKPDIFRPKATSVSGVTSKSRPALSKVVSTDLHNRTKIKEAMILAEILGPPVSRRPKGGRH